jgi:hypothetical protein
MTEETTSVVSSMPIIEPNADDEMPIQHIRDEQHVTQVETSESNTTVASSLNQRTFAPLNIPLSRRRETLTILVWFMMPWTCFYLSFVLLRSNNWYIVCTFVLYLTWMMFLQKYPRQGGFRQQWLRRLEWWHWFSGK